MNKKIFGIDRVHLLVPHGVSIPLNKLSRFVKLDYRNLYRYSFRNKLMLFQPSEDSLRKFSYDIPSVYYLLPNYLEICEDEIVSSKREAESLFESYVKNLSPNYFRNSKVVRYDYSQMQARKYRFVQDKWYDSTLYCLSDSVVYTAYPRISKFTGEYCLHKEWRFYKSSTVRRYTNINSIMDLYHFFPDIEIFMGFLDNKRLKQKRINIEKLTSFLSFESSKFRKRFTHSYLKCKNVENTIAFKNHMKSIGCKRVDRFMYDMRQ